VDRGFGQGLLGIEVVEEPTAADARALADEVELRRVLAPRKEQLLGGIQQRFARSGGAGHRRSLTK
jgi:phage-related protein